MSNPVSTNEQKEGNSVSNSAEKEVHDEDLAKISFKRLKLCFIVQCARPPPCDVHKTWIKSTSVLPLDLAKLF